MGRKKSQRQRSSKQVSALSPEACSAVMAGDITLAQAANFSAADLEAVAQYADALRRQGALEEAAHYYEQLAIFAPYEPRWWCTLAGLKQRLGEPSLALVAYQMVEYLGALDAAGADSRNLCLEQALRTPISQQPRMNTQIAKGGLS